MAKSSEEVVFEGWLTKSPPAKRIFRAKWRRRWFLLTHSGDIPGQYILTYYTDRNRRKIKGVIDLDHCEQVDLGLKHEDKHLKFDHVFDIKTPNRTYYLAADTQEEMKSWVTCICRVCGLKATNEDEDIGLPMNIPGIEFAENLDGQKFTETPPVSPASPSPYIAISECITEHDYGSCDVSGVDEPPVDPDVFVDWSGVESPSRLSNFSMVEPSKIPGKSPVRDPKDFRSLLEYNNRNSSRFISHSNDSYEYHPQNSYVNYGNLADRNYVNDLQDPRFYDCPRPLAPKRNTKNEQGSPLQSPTDSDSVFNEDEWVHLRNDSDISKKSRPSDSSIDMETSAIQRFVKPADPQLTFPPPRPPKPPHITPPPCYLNLNSVPTKQENETTNEDKTKTVQQKILTDDMYDFPRSHNVETESEKNTLQRRHCYNNAAPTKCAEGIIFRYDISPKPSTSSVTSVFRYDLEATQDLEPSSPVHSHSSSTPAYSNLPSPNLLAESPLILPPTVNRELKPKRKLSDAHSTSSNTEPPSPRTAAPSVDRKLKPTTPLQEANMRKVFQVGDEEGSKKIRAAPSPTPHSLTHLADDLHDGEVDVYVEINKKMQYLDLDLDGSPSNATKTLPKSNESDTVYKQVDFIKTEAFNITRNNLEKERQEPVTTFVKK